jgi:hypothetical protein
MFTDIDHISKHWLLLYIRHERYNVYVWGGVGFVSCYAVTASHRRRSAHDQPIPGGDHLPLYRCAG